MSSPITGWFTTEIQKMMHGFGDCRKPLLESAKLIETIVYQQMTLLLDQLTDIAALRGSRHIGIEDILFMMRNDKVKLRRLLRYIELTDMKYSARSVEEDESLEDSKPAACKKRMKICYDFLNSIDSTGELIALFDETGHDDIKLERLLRAELQSRNMDTQHYKEFCEARQASFGRKIKLQKFKDWLLNTNELKLTALALEVVSYLAYETVAQIVDLCLLVQKDEAATVNNRMDRFMPPAMNHDASLTESATQQTPNSPSSAEPLNSSQSSIASSALNSSTGSSQSKTSKVAGKKKSDGTDLQSANAITPAHIKEVVRRCNTGTSPFHLFSKRPPGGARSPLFCC